MADDPAARLIQELEKTSRGEGAVSDLAEALKAHPAMTVLLSKEEMDRNEAALKEARGDGSDEEPGLTVEVASEAPSLNRPLPMGPQTPDGRSFVPRLFTDREKARAYGEKAGLLKEGKEQAVLAESPWGEELHRLLMAECPAVLIDDETEHKVILDRNVFGQIYALLTLEDFARRPTLYMLARGDHPLIQLGDSGAHLGYVFDSRMAAQAATPRLPRMEGEVRVIGAPPAEILGRLLAEAVEMLVVNPVLPDERPYLRDDLLTMLSLLGVDPPPAAGAAISSGGKEMPFPLRFALQTSTLPLWTGLGTVDADSRKTFLEWTAKAKDESALPWQVLEVLAYHVNAYVPRFPQNVEGLFWPQRYRHPDPEQNAGVCHVFTEEDRVKEALASQPPEGRTYASLTGIEALRWIWATPEEIQDILWDYPDEEGWFACPAHWALSALFPAFLEFGDFSGVHDLPLGLLGTLPGGGLRPEAIEAFRNGWSKLQGYASPLESGHVVREGVSFAPAFTSAETLAAFRADRPAALPDPEPSGDAPPFESWMRATAGCGGVLLDPASPQPLALDHTDLLLLHLWCSGDAPPDPAAALARAATLLREGNIGRRIAGRIAADLPRYFIVFTEAEENRVGLLHVPDTDAGALFTTAEAAEAFLEGCRKQGLQGTEKASVLPVLSRWSRSALLLAATHFTEAWIDPVPNSHAGLRLDRTGLEASVERLHERLKPRVPGFAIDTSK